MGGVLFSVTVSVSAAAALFFLLRGRIARRYGFRMVYILSLILAIRLVVPYSIQLPDSPKWSISLPAFVPALWIAGAAVCLIWQAGKYLLYRRNLLSRTGRSENAERILEAVKQSLFISAEIPVLVSYMAEAPMLLGFAKPVIVLPRQSYTEAELEMILRHELMHFKHGDAYKKLFFAAVAAVQWFNPFAWLLMRECCGSLEVLCDEAVTKNADRTYKRDYCNMLLKTAARRSYFSAASYFSSKEMLKMRIDSVFDGKSKKRGGRLIVGSVLCMSVISGMFCSCTVETPQDVIDEMNRIESGVSNEKEQGVIDGESAEITLRPVSEVTATAREELAKIAAADGIFKLDNCEIIIPQVDSMPILAQNLYGIDTPQQVYEQLRYIEKEWLGDNYYPDEAFIAVPYGTPHREEWTIEEFLSRDKLAAIYNSRENYDGEFYGSIETMGISLRLWETPLLDSYLKSDFDNDWLSKEKALQKVNCFTADESALSQKLTLTNGEIALREAIKAAEDYMNSFRYREDEKISYKVQWAYIFEMQDGKNAIQFDLRCFVGDIPFEYVSVDLDKEVPFSCGDVVSNDHMEMIMIRTDGFDSIITTQTSVMFTPTEKTVTEIITVDEVFEILKHRLSNSVVWDIYEISLGYTLVLYDKDATWETSPYYTHPIWNVTISTGTKYYQADIDAVTGELYFWEDFRER